MKQFKLSEQTKKSIEKTTGLNYETIVNSDVAEIDRKIEKKTGKKLRFSTHVGGLQPRGSVYLMLNRFITAKDINRSIDRILR